MKQEELPFHPWPSTRQPLSAEECICGWLYNRFPSLRSCTEKSVLRFSGITWKARYITVPQTYKQPNILKSGAADNQGMPTRSMSAKAVIPQLASQSREYHF